MSNVYFISDLHLGHKKILEFAGEFRGGSNVEEHDEWIVEQWNSVVRKRDLVWLLGDVCFSRDSFHHLAALNGSVKLCLGNHDRKFFDQWKYHLQPNEVIGLGNYKNYWLSHCPIHPMEMRGRLGNIHGHLHQKVVPNERYFNVCVEHCYGKPFSYEEIRDTMPKLKLEEECRRS